MTTSVRVETPSTTTISTRRRSDWAKSYALRLVLSDSTAVLVAVVGSYLVLFGTSTVTVGSGASTSPDLNLAQVALATGVLWMLSLAAFGTRSKRIVGSGTTEYKRVVDSSVVALGAFLFLSYFLALDVPRTYAMIVFPAGLVAITASRWIWRQWLLARRASGTHSSRVVLVGSQHSVTMTAAELMRTPGAGYRVVGAAVTDGPATGELGSTGIPLIGNVDDVPSLLDAHGADTVVATGSDDLSSHRVRELSWHLDAQRHQLVVAPSITDIGGARIHLRPVAGLPLIHVETPHYDGPQKFAKRVFDIVGSGVILALLAPLLAAIAAIIRKGSDGPVFYSQERVGLNGQSFRILKFRSMYTDADERRAELLGELAEGKRLFKLENDPRVTPIGRVLRKYSLDELPQLLNVLRGDMSLVGPRPALPTEVSDYDSKERRRLAVLPGMSGLWQVSGRSNLDWEDGIRLDLYYVENWSITGDLIILWRTARAVLFSEGAY